MTPKIMHSNGKHQALSCIDQLNPGFNPQYFKEFPQKVIWGNLTGMLLNVYHFSN